jgi:carbon catabolite-derepressing protein kinase
MHGGDWNAPRDSCWVYVTIQLYSIEKDFYLVDFKCAGYERLVRRFAREISGSEEADVVAVDQAPEGYDDSDGAVNEDGEELMGAGRSVEEKEVSSPFPFLDVASRLIISLAEAQD